ncbi:MAG: hypothetical protein KDB84_01895, partial [Flavobacteriales bacterium]|nr:hypothetical protein [Flavobacteriales bacterium]
PSARITCLHADSIGVLVGTDNGYAELTTDLEWLPPSERFTGYFPIALPDTRVITALRGRSGDLWFGTPSGAAHFTKHNGQPRLRTISEANGLGHAVVRCLLQDRSGAVWIGTGFGGVSKFTSDAFIHYTERDGLRSRTVGAMHRTPDGVLWIGTVGGGLARLEQDGLHTLGVEHGLTDPFILGLGEDQEGHLLVATATRGLFRYKNDRFVRYTAASGMDADRVNVVHLDDNGRIWAGAANGLFLDPGDGLFTHIGEPTMNVTDVVAAGDTAWFTTDQGLFVLHLHQLPWRPVAVVHLPPVAMNTLERDGQGNLWIGTQQHGLYRCRNTFVDSINMDHGLGSRNVEQVMLDAYENIWLGTRNGVDMLELDVLQERVLEVEHFGADEGFIGIGAFRNACMLDTDSALWFGTVRGATRYDPRAVLTDTREPLIHLTDLRLFNERVDWTPWSDSTTTAGLPQNLELPHDRNHLTFAFTGISLAYPEKVRYRYMLEGHDPDWSPITATDKVTYTNLPPGEYTFRILARNASGIWTQQAADFKFSIDPPFWATTPFRIGAGGLLLLGLFGVVRFRERSLRRDRERLEGMVQVRTSELAREKDRSDALLLNILPSSTAEELRTKGSADARRYESCTVLFS